MNRRNNWYLTVVMVSATFFISTQAPIGDWAKFLHLDLIKFVDVKSAATLIDQRTSNIATIISMTLAVTAMLISNVVVKEPFIYQLLYRRSYLNFIIIYTLCTIGCLIIVGTFKDSFADGKEFNFYNGVMCGTYMVISVLVLIGHLFKTLYEFINATNLQEILTKELILEAKAILYLDLMDAYSSAHYRKIMTDNGLRELNYGNAVESELPTDVIKSTLRIPDYVRPRLIYNVDLSNLGSLITDSSVVIDRFFRVVRLNTVTGIYHDFIYLSTEEKMQRKFSKKYRNCFVLKSPKAKTIAATSFRDYFDHKLSECVEDKKFREVRKILVAYKSLYDLQFKNKPIYE